MLSIMRTWEQLNEELQELLANEPDELEQTLLKIKYNKLISDAWQAERTAKYSKTEDEIKALVGTKVQVSYSSSKFTKRVLKEDSNGFYTLIQNQKAYVKWNPVFREFEVTHWTLK